MKRKGSKRKGLVEVGSGIMIVTAPGCEYAGVPEPVHRAIEVGALHRFLGVAQERLEDLEECADDYGIDDAARLGAIQEIEGVIAALEQAIGIVAGLEQVEESIQLDEDTIRAIVREEIDKALRPAKKYKTTGDPRPHHKC